jgi:hypothetical protein
LPSPVPPPVTRMFLPARSFSLNMTGSPIVFVGRQRLKPDEAVV